MNHYLPFGKLKTEDLRKLDYRLRRSGIRHDSRIAPSIPKQDRGVELIVTTGPNVSGQRHHLPVSKITGWYNIGGEPGLHGPGEGDAGIEFTIVKAEWDTTLSAYITEWRATLPRFKESTLVRYRIRADLVGNPERCLFSDWPDIGHLMEVAMHREDGDYDFLDECQAGRQGDTFAYLVDPKPAPDWVKKAKVYHIVVDRFCCGPEYQPHPDWHGFPTDRKIYDRHGGTLAGIRLHVDEIKKLGFDTIWLSPVFKSPSYHGYDVSDYYEIDPRFGTMDQFDDLVEAIHGLKMRIILDVPFNHCSIDHPAYALALEAGQQVMQPDEPALQFHFGEQYQHGYRAYANVKQMPAFDFDDPHVREYFFGFADLWLGTKEVDGLRLDVAEGPGPSFWARFRHHLQERNISDKWLFGEVVQPVDVLRTYAGRLDGCLDFLWEQQVRLALAHERASLNELGDFLQNHWKNTFETWQPESPFLCPVFLDNHDIDRFVFAATNDERRLCLGLAILLTWPTPPVMFYGTEFAQSQERGADSGVGLDASRVPLHGLWNFAKEGTLSNKIRKLIEVRDNNPELIEGTQSIADADRDWLVLARDKQPKHFLIALNRSCLYEKTLPARFGRLQVLWASTHFPQVHVPLVLPPLSAAVVEIMEG